MVDVSDFPEDLAAILPDDWGEVARQRECGDCDACCTVLAVQDLQKAAGVACHHLMPDGGGCKIHDLRPQICRQFFCGWRFGFGTDNHRPDKSGVVVVLPNELTNACNIFLDFDWDGQSTETLPPEVALMLESLARAGAPLHIFMTGADKPIATILHKESPLMDSVKKGVGNGTDQTSD